MNTPFDEQAPRRPGLFARLRAAFLTGLVVIAPVGLTVWLIWSVVGWIDGFVLPLVPGPYQPDHLIQDLLGLDRSAQINVRGIGVVIFLIFTIVIGWMAKGLIGRSILRFALFQWFLMALSVRPGKYLAISAQRLPSCA